MRGLRGRPLRAGGYTLLELMTVVAIISILALIALPIYKGFAVRAQVSEGLGLMGNFKTSIGYYYLVNGRWPLTNRQAGLALPTSYSGKYVHSIGIEPIMSGATYSGQIEVVIVYDSGKISVLGTNNTIAFRPDAESGGSFTWDCSYGTVPDQYRPHVCR